MRQEKRDITMAIQSYSPHERKVCKQCGGCIICKDLDSLEQLHRPCVGHIGFEHTAQLASIITAPYMQPKDEDCSRPSGHTGSHLRSEHYHPSIQALLVVNFLPVMSGWCIRQCDTLNCRNLCCLPRFHDGAHACLEHYVPTGRVHIVIVDVVVYLLVLEQQTPNGYKKCTRRCDIAGCYNFCFAPSGHGGDQHLCINHV